MKVPVEKIERATAEGEDRPTLRSVYLDAGEGTLCAADGFILAVVPAKSTGNDTSGPIPVEAFDYVRGHPGHTMCITNDAVSVGIATFDRPDGVDDSIAKRIDTVVKMANETIKDHQVKVTLSMSLLRRLADAICDDSRQYVTLYIPRDVGRGIAVRSITNEECMGIIMPLLTPEEERKRNVSAAEMESDDYE